MERRGTARKGPRSNTRSQAVPPSGIRMPLMEFNHHLLAASGGRRGPLSPDRSLRSGTVGTARGSKGSGRAHAWFLHGGSGGPRAFRRTERLPAASPFQMAPHCAMLPVRAHARGAAIAYRMRRSAALVSTAGASAVFSPAASPPPPASPLLQPTAAFPARAPAGGAGPCCALPPRAGRPRPAPGRAGRCGPRPCG